MEEFCTKLKTRFSIFSSAGGSQEDGPKKNMVQFGLHYPAVKIHRETQKCEKIKN